MSVSGALPAAFDDTMSMYACATTFMTSSVTCAILYVGSSLVSEGSLSTGTLVSFLLYQYNLTGALSSIADIWSGMQEAIGSARKIFSILDRQPALTNDGEQERHYYLFDVGFAQFDIDFARLLRPSHFHSSFRHPRTSRSFAS